MKITIDISVPVPKLASVLRAMAKSKGQLCAEKAARFVPVSKKSFGLWFKENARTTFREKRLEVKLDIGRYLLAATAMSIPDIASHLGYSERSKFEKSFKNFYGLPPAQYRREHLSRKLVS